MILLSSPLKYDPWEMWYVYFFHEIVKVTTKIVKSKNFEKDLSSTSVDDEHPERI